MLVSSVHCIRTVAALVVDYSARSPRYWSIVCCHCFCYRCCYCRSYSCHWYCRWVCFCVQCPDRTPSSSSSYVHPCQYRSCAYHRPQDPAVQTYLDHSFVAARNRQRC
uniref:Putative secreted protein n=1 Tax=Anopheles triannulatus TaxID=58253 RepID=A0A2M4B679_9DIPT